jgi:hypothetical protein
VSDSVGGPRNDRWPKRESAINLDRKSRFHRYCFLGLQDSERQARERTEWIVLRWMRGLLAWLRMLQTELRRDRGRGTEGGGAEARGARRGEVAGSERWWCWWSVGKTETDGVAVRTYYINAGSQSSSKKSIVLFSFEMI